MFDHDPLATFFCLGVVATPLLLVAILGILSLLDRPLSERSISKLVAATVITGLVSALGISALMFVRGETQLELPHSDASGPHWDWIKLGDASKVADKAGDKTPEAHKTNDVHVHFHFSVKFLFDRL